MPNIFITGSGRRIGRGLALKFADKGWNVGIHYFNSAEMANKTYSEVLAKGVKAVLVKGDVRNYSEMESALNEFVEKVGVPDVLINNSGVFPEMKKVEDISPEFWEDTMKANLFSEFFCSKIYRKILNGSENKQGRIINIASLGSIEIWKERIPYNVSKGGLIQLTKGLAREFAPEISVNCIMPGTILIPDEAPDTDSVIINKDRIPMKRHGDINDIFDAVYFFATCSRFITGQFLMVDGGANLIK